MQKNSIMAKHLKKHAMVRLFMKLQWVAIPMIIVVAVEYGLRKSDLNLPFWYSRAESIARQKKVDYVFIGSSRMGAAVVEETFNRCLSACRGGKVVSINLGQAHSFPHLHYLGLRNLFEKYPASFANVTVFIEAIAAVPPYQYHKSWKSSWIPRQPQLLVPLLRYSDLGRFWKSGDSAADKLYVTFKFLLAQSYIVSFRERTRQKFEQEGQSFFARSIRRLLGLPLPPPAPAPIFQPVGVIWNNPDFIEGIRKKGLEYFGNLSRTMRPILEHWDKSILADIIALIAEHGGKVCFVNLPISSAEAAVYRTKNHASNVRIIKKKLDEWKTPILTPNFIYADDDIPDTFHLQLSRAAEFTEELAQSYIDFQSAHAGVSCRQLY